MPKELYEISLFNKGIISTPSEEDIPPNAASYSLDIEPTAVDGKLIGRKSDVDHVVSGLTSVKSPAFIDSEVSGIKDLVYHDGSDFRHIGNFYGDATITGAHTTGANSTSLKDTSKTFGINELVGMKLTNTTDSSSYGYVVSNTATEVVTSVTIDILSYADGGGGTVTITAPLHGLIVAQSIVISGTINYNGTYAVTAVVDTNSFKITESYTAVDGASTLTTHLKDGTGNDWDVSDAYVIAKVSRLLGSFTTDDICIAKNNRELHIGTGTGSDNSPKWIGYNNHERWGQDIDGVQYENAELLVHDDFPSMYKVVSVGNSLYGIGHNGQHIYQFDPSTNELIGKSEDDQFDNLTAIGTDGTSIYVSDDRGASLRYLIRVSTNLKISYERLIRRSGTAINIDISDIECTLNKIWFLDKPAAPTTKYQTAYLHNASYPSSADVLPQYVAITSVKVPYQSNGDWTLCPNPNDETEVNDGAFMETSVNQDRSAAQLTSDEDHIEHMYMPLALTKCDNTTQVVFHSSVLLEGGASANVVYHHHRKDAGTYEHYVYSYPIDGYVAWIIDETHDDYNLKGNLSTCVPVKLQPGITMSSSDQFNGVVNVINDIATFYSCTDGFIYTTDKLTEISDYQTIFNDDDSAEVGNRLNTMASFNYNSANEDASEQGAIVKKHDDIAHVIDSDLVPGLARLHVFEGKSGESGAWMYWANWVYSGVVSMLFATFALKNRLDISITTSAGSGFDATKRYFYKASYLYDGYQESPLIRTGLQSTGNNDPRTVTIKLYQSLQLSSRITHVKIYRSEAADAGTTEDTLYRLIKEIPLNSAWAETADDEWGPYRTYAFADLAEAKQTSTYDSNAGISELINSTMVKRKLSTTLNNTLFVADCSHPRLDNAENYMFKSQPYKFDMFDWTQDFLILPEKPVALASFSGRVYAFSENNTYRIEPNSFYIEDTYEGIGCAGPNSFSITDHGMCFANANNVFLHDGKYPRPIADSVIRSNNSFGYQELYTNPPHVIFDSYRNTFMILMNDTHAWCFNLAQKRWDYWTLPLTTALNSAFQGKTGEMYVGQGTKITKWASEAATKNFTWKSKDIVIGQSTQEKMFYTVNKVGTADIAIAGSNGVAVSVYPHRDRHIKLTISGDSSSEYIDSLGVVFRSFFKVFEGQSGT